MMRENKAEYGLNPSQYELFPFYVLFLCLLSCSLNAPRDNPQDPNLGGNICGRILSRNFYGIEGAEIYIPLADVITYSDTNGYFGLYVLPEDTMWVFCTHENYSPESLIIVTETGTIDTLMVYLNGLPYFLNCSATTHHYERNWPPDPLYFCYLSTTVGDVDGVTDIESVWVDIPTLSYTKRLIYDSSEQEYSYTLLADELPGNTLEVLVGQGIFFNVVDKDSAIVRSSPYYISRIIYHSPEIIFPQGGLDTLKTDTTFIWHKFDHGYYVWYHGEIIKIVGGGPAGIAYSFDVFAQNDTTFDFEIAFLDSGEYYWTLEVMDSLRNSSRTKEQRFLTE
jgi:hypothetical protein